MKIKDTTSEALADYNGTGTKLILSQQNRFCLEKMDSVSTKSTLSQQNGFCPDRMDSVPTKWILSQQNGFCSDRMDFVSTECVLSQQNGILCTKLMVPHMYGGHIESSLGTSGITSAPGWTWVSTHQK